MYYFRLASALLLLSVVMLASCGTPCPARSFLYPCHCTSVPLTKKTDFTIVTCHRLPMKTTLQAIYSTLRSMQIDRFVLHDSFWETEKLEATVSDHQKKLPQNWFSLLRIKEMEIVDSKLSPCFACDITVGCPNVTPVRLSVHNSSTDDSICTLCENKLSWLNCLSKLKEFHFVDNKLKSITADFFPFDMKELSVLNISHNEIRVIEKGAFEKIPKLTHLDLSHNMISDITKGIFGVRQSVLTHLDLSFNFIKRLSSDIFKMNPYMIHFYARNNMLQKLPEDDWKYLSPQIRTIDIRDNQIECDCHMIWVNCTLKVHVNLLGNCITPGYEDTPLRRASIYMSERCVDGEIQVRDNTTKRNACTEWNKTRQHEAFLLESGSMPTPMILQDPPRTRRRQNQGRNNP